MSECAVIQDGFRAIAGIRCQNLRASAAVLLDRTSRSPAHTPQQQALPHSSTPQLSRVWQEAHNFPAWLISCLTHQQGQPSAALKCLNSITWRPASTMAATQTAASSGVSEKHLENSHADMPSLHTPPGASHHQSLNPTPYSLTRQGIAACNRAGCHRSWWRSWRCLQPRSRALRPWLPHSRSRTWAGYPWTPPWAGLPSWVAPSLMPPKVRSILGPRASGSNQNQNRETRSGAQHIQCCSGTPSPDRGRWHRSGACSPGPCSAHVWLVGRLWTLQF